MKRRQFLQLTLAVSVVGCSNSSNQNPATNVVTSPDNPAGDPNRPSLTFGVIADPQYADQPTVGTRFYRNSLDKLQIAIEELNRHELDFVVTLGDVIDKHFQSFAKIMPLYDGLTAPHRLVLGNHDFDVADADKLNVPTAMNLKSDYYSENWGAWRLIYLDGTEIATYRYPEQDARTAGAQFQLQRYQDRKLPNAMEWNSAVSNTQLDWLRSELDAARTANQRVIICCHFPVMPVNQAHNLWNARDVIELLEQYDHVAAWFNGHNHAGNYASHQECHFVNFKGMVETENETAYAVVKCFPDRIEIDGFGVEPDQELDA